MTDNSADAIVTEHYREEARQHGLDPSSTMADQVTRDLEVSVILQSLAYALGPLDHATGTLLDVGCGNGYLLELVRQAAPHVELTGADYSGDMVELARQRALDRCTVAQEDVRALSFGDAAFDVVVSERCLINLLDPESQGQGIAELHRVLKPAGHLILVEAHAEGLANLNTAREELGLPANAAPYHNRWFEAGELDSHTRDRFVLVEAGDGDVPARNFLSTHYFVSRVLYPAVTRAEIRYNTEFVKFFRFLPPQGSFSPIQLHVLRKR